MSNDKEDHSTLKALSKPTSVSASLESIFTPSCNSNLVKVGPVEPSQISNSGKRFSTDPPSDLCSASENLPLSLYSKRQRTKSGPDQMESTAEKQEGNGKKVISGSNNALPTINTHNPLSERNIRVDNDINNSFNKNSGFDSSSNNKNSRLMADVNVSNSQPSVIVNSHTNNSNNNNYDAENNDCITKSSGNCDSTNKGELVSEIESLSSAITSLENSQRSLASSTLDYVARLPDGCSRQLDRFEEPDCTPPQASNSTPHYPCSGDEDDDNYLDSSDDDNGEDGLDSNTNNDEDESCGEGQFKDFASKRKFSISTVYLIVEILV